MCLLDLYTMLLLLFTIVNYQMLPNAVWCNHDHDNNLNSLNATTLTNNYYYRSDETSTFTTANDCNGNAALLILLTTYLLAVYATIIIIITIMCAVVNTWFCPLHMIIWFELDVTILADYNYDRSLSTYLLRLANHDAYLYKWLTIVCLCAHYFCVISLFEQSEWTQYYNDDDIMQHCALSSTTTIIVKWWIMMIMQ